ncbi:hypothetical protein HPP92_012424 [Vanilla planifolia]|uniref:Protein kinase domain-containing protein n=1 Tax=Vanilla planifolia TaxID=51239 RepID=A0A835QWX9_VANPL|nr:hypothetical protein HPP92_012424 [Vanilla planifolia]
MAPKAKPKPLSPSANSQAPPSLEELFSSLHRHAQNFEYEQAVKIADQVLSIAPGDEDALRCKIVALIKSDSIDKALSVIQKSEDLPVDLNFYKAYCLYRQNKLQEALESLSNQERSTMALQLEAQILYRLGKMDTCMQSYEKLQKFKIDSLDLKTNLIATLVSAGRSNEVQGVMDALKIKASSSFEIAYNTACSLIEKKRYTEAEQHLLSARRLGQEMLVDEDYADDEIETELAPIAVQLAYIQQLLGNKLEAIESYLSIINRNLADASSLAVATNNLIVLRGTKDASDSLRKLDRFIQKADGSKLFKVASGLDFKLSQRQRESLYFNRLLLLLQANRIEQVSIMKMLDHPNIVKLVEVIDDPLSDHFYMVLEYAEGKWVCDSSGIAGDIGESKCRRYLRDVVSGLLYLHAHNIVHGDIKPDNLLVSSTGTVKIGDFSVSQVFEDDNDELRRSPGTPVFTAPECCLGLTYHGRAADTWAVGVTLYFMIVGKYPFLGDTLQETYDKIVNSPLFLPDNLNPQLRNLLERLLCKDPKHRISLPAAAEHPWVVEEEGPIPEFHCRHKNAGKLSG